MTKLELIRAAVARDAYGEDPAKVAEAIVARLLAGRSVRETAER